MMCTSVKILIFFLIFGTIFENTVLCKCKRHKLTTKTFHPIKGNKKDAHRESTTLKINPIEWFAEVDEDMTEKENKIDETTATKGETTTKEFTPTATKVSKSPTLNPHLSLRKWEPIDIPIKFRIPIEQNRLVKACKSFINTSLPFDFSMMADIWETTYYQLKEMMHCFKIHIRRVRSDDRQSYKTLFGDFGGRVKWDQIFLEINSMTPIGRKHFLQGNNTNRGIMENIIISEDLNTQSHVLTEENPDQWMVFQKLLLMRDCETGDTVVFAKVPQIPLQKDIEDALDAFGGNYEGGKQACMEDHGIFKGNNRHYSADEDFMENL